MTQKIFVADSNVATFVCPECNASKTTDVTKFKSLPKAVRLKIKCTCGNSYSVILERRKYYRKETGFPGIYVYRPAGGQPLKGNMTVVDISRGGLKMKLPTQPKIKVGSVFEVEFHLDDKQRSLIRKELIVRNVVDQFICAEFSSIDPSDPSDKALGFYLF